MITYYRDMPTEYLKQRVSYRLAQSIAERKSARDYFSRGAAGDGFCGREAIRAAEHQMRQAQRIGEELRRRAQS